MTKGTQEQGTKGGAGRQTRVLGTLRSADGAGVVRIVDRYDTDMDDLWSALTDPSRLARWYGDVEGDLRRDGQFTVYLEGADLTARGRVEVCEPPRRLTVVTRETDDSWRGGDGPPPFDQTIAATLTADGAQTLLVIEARGIPLDRTASYGAGWQIHAENLAHYVAGRMQGEDAGARWGELVPHYRDLAATLLR